MTHVNKCIRLILGLLLCVTPLVQPLNFDFAFNFSTETALDLLVPTTRDGVSPKCREQSRLYVEQLRELKLWAVEMLDASSKFPSGVLFGSKVDFGNFDECIQVNVPLENGEKIQGQYCNARFRIEPPQIPTSQSNKKFQYGYYEQEQCGIENASVWDKVVAFSNDRARSTRNDFYFTYCLPSSCTPQDLQNSLRDIVDQINSLSEFRVEVFVDARNCQIKEPVVFTTGDLTFLGILGIYVLIVLAASAYECGIQLEELSDWKIQGTLHDTIVCFSLLHNLRKLTTKSHNENGLKSIHGLKAMSMFFVIMGHRIMFGIGSPILNPNFVESMYSRIEAAVLLNGPIIVDTFFSISGFLACYLMLQEFDRLKKVNVLVIYVHRFIRLTPAYAVMVAFYATIFIQMGSGPFYKERVGAEQERCQASWWANLLYVNNYVSKDRICMFQSWYMTCDMHYFLAAPILVWLLKKRPIAGLTSLFGLILISVCVVFAVVFFSNEDGILLLYVNFLKDPVVHSTFKNVYIPTHMRASPYFIGMFAAYLKHKMRLNGYKMPNLMVYLGWIICIVVIEVTVYGAFIFYVPDIMGYDPLISATYASLHHFTFSVCISWMIIAISEGNGRWIEPFLSWEPLAYLSRITYTAFLCHGVIQLYSVSILRYSNYASIFNLVYNTAGDITLSYIAGLALSLLFEAPIISLEQILLRKTRKNGGSRTSTSDRSSSTTDSDFSTSNTKISTHL